LTQDRVPSNTGFCVSLRPDCRAHGGGVLRQHERRFAFVLNRENPGRETLNRSAAKLLRKLGVLLSEHVQDRAAYVSALLIVLPDPFSIVHRVAISLQLSDKCFARYTLRRLEKGSTVFGPLGEQPASCCEVSEGINRAKACAGVVRARVR
jgi:hypothetical protein